MSGSLKGWNDCLFVSSRSVKIIIILIINWGKNGNEKFRWFKSVILETSVGLGLEAEDWGRGKGFDVRPYFVDDFSLRCLLANFGSQV